MRLLIVGGSVSGLVTALLAARRGHEVVVVDRDPSPRPSTADAAWEEWHHPGVPQFRQLHGYQALAHRLLAEHAPAVFDALHVGGAQDVVIANGVGGDAVIQFRSRRATFEFVLRQAALAAPGVRLLQGVGVTGLVFEDTAGGVARAVGVRTESGDQLFGDLVVDASGRNSALPAWISEGGGRPARCESVQTGQVYFTRWYRLVEDQVIGRPSIRADLDFATCMVMPADRGWFSVTFFGPAGDRDLRRVLLRPDGFDRAAQLVMGADTWVDIAAAQPVSDVMFMGHLANQLRSLRDEKGPVVTGVVALGDAAACTNPTWGRGVALAIQHAVELVELLGEDHDDAFRFAAAFAEVTKTTLGPWYHDTVALDIDVNARWSQANGEHAAMASSGLPFTHRRVLAAARADALLLDRYTRYRNLLCPPASFWLDPEVRERVAAHPYGDEPASPTRLELLGASNR